MKLEFVRRKAEIKYEKLALSTTFPRGENKWSFNQVIYGPSLWLIPWDLLQQLWTISSLVGRDGVGLAAMRQQKTPSTQGRVGISADKEQHIFNQSLKLAHNSEDIYAADWKSRKYC